MELPVLTVGELPPRACIDEIVRRVFALEDEPDMADFAKLLIPG
jgi:hypothetical protein